MTFHLVPGLGLSTFTVSDAWTGFGVALEGIGEFRFNSYVGLRLRAAWGLTEWDRAAYWIQHGVGAGAWTAGAYSTVGDWLVTPKELFLIKFIPAFFAFALLLLGFLYVGLVLVLAPFAATSYVQLGVSAAGHLPLDNDVDLYAEAGMGSMLYWHPRNQAVRMGFGPVLGVGLTVKKVGFGIHGMWVPNVMQSSPQGAPDVVAATLSVRYAF